MSDLDLAAFSQARAERNAYRTSEALILPQAYSLPFISRLRRTHCL